MAWSRVNINPKARTHVLRALRADFASLYVLIKHLSNSEISAFLLEMYRVKGPRVAFRYFMRDFWIRQHYSLIEAAGNLATVVEMFRYADFPIPDSLGPTVKAYRGTRGISAMESASTGMCWSLNRDIACYHAFPDSRGGEVEPLVIEAEIPRAHILMYTGGTLLSEITVVPIATSPGVEYGLSLPVEDWLAGHLRYVTDRAASLDVMKQNSHDLGPLERATRDATLRKLVGPLTNRF